MFGNAIDEYPLENISIFTVLKDMQDLPKIRNGSILKNLYTLM